MKKEENCCCHGMAWGILIALFGIFFLIANFMPDTNLMKFWPIFLIVAGGYKAICCHSCKKGSCNR